MSYLISPNIQNVRFFSDLRDYVATEKPILMYCGFAYVTKRGAENFIQNLSSPDWENIEKRFIVGINQGISEPVAIKLLQNENNSQVRLFFKGNK